MPFPWDRQRLVLAALDAGFRGFDVAPAYGNGLDEVELGLALKARRHGVVIHTKFGIPMPLYGTLSRLAFPLLRVVDKFANPSYSRRYARRCFGPKELTRSLHGSLRRLRTDHVDGLFLHEPLQPMPPSLWEDLASTVEKLKDKGLVGAFGTAGPLGPLGEAADQPALDVIQAPLSEILGLASMGGKRTIGYSVYQAFEKESQGIGFREFIAHVRARADAPSLILATTRLATLNTFRELLA